MKLGRRKTVRLRVVVDGRGEVRVTDQRGRVVEDVTSVAMNWSVGGVAEAKVTVCPMPADYAVDATVRELGEPPKEAYETRPEVLERQGAVIHSPVDESPQAVDSAEAASTDLFAAGPGIAPPGAVLPAVDEDADLDTDSPPINAAVPATGPPTGEDQPWEEVR